MIGLGHQETGGDGVVSSTLMNTSMDSRGTSGGISLESATKSTTVKALPMSQRLMGSQKGMNGLKDDDDDIAKFRALVSEVRENLMKAMDRFCSQKGV